MVGSRNRPWTEQTIAGCLNYETAADLSFDSSGHETLGLCGQGSSVYRPGPGEIQPKLTEGRCVAPRSSPSARAVLQFTFEHSSERESRKRPRRGERHVHQRPPTQWGVFSRPGGLGAEAGSTESIPETVNRSSRETKKPRRHSGAFVPEQTSDPGVLLPHG